MDNPDIFISSFQESKHISDFDLYDTRQRIMKLEVTLNTIYEIVQQLRMQSINQASKITELESQIMEIKARDSKKDTKEVNYGEENTDTMERKSS